MVWFYELYPDAINLPQLGGDFNGHQNLPQAGVNSDSPVFHIPWGHNKLIIDKCKGDKDKALFFVKESLSNNWSRAVLMNFLDTNLYERKGKAVTNFKLSLPAEQSDLAQQITRDPYNFDFLTLRSDITNSFFICYIYYSYKMKKYFHSVIHQTNSRYSDWVN